MNKILFVTLIVNQFPNSQFYQTTPYTNTETRGQKKLFSNERKYHKSHVEINAICVLPSQPLTLLKKYTCPTCGNIVLPYSHILYNNLSSAASFPKSITLQKRRHPIHVAVPENNLPFNDYRKTDNTYSTQSPKDYKPVRSAL